ncbi:hypothetical protein PF003_g37876 [Phytophthora fragariae]|nr:hypothetical protein PF003_g37876 [Phytophthora fragariae]
MLPPRMRGGATPPIPAQHLPVVCRSAGAPKSERDARAVTPFRVVLKHNSERRLEQQVPGTSH